MPTDPSDNVFGRLARPRRELTAAPAAPSPPTDAPAPAPEERPPEGPRRSSRKSAPKRKAPKGEATKGKASKGERATPTSGDRTNYLGDGFYKHKDKVTKKFVAYVSADVKQSVKVEAAKRGMTMGELTEEVFRAAGFGSPAGEQGP